MGRRAILQLAIAAVAAVAPAAASSAGAAQVLTVRPHSLLHMNGTDVVCSVDGTSTTTVSCFHLPGGPATKARKGYAVTASETAITVLPPLGARAVLHVSQPPLAGQPAIAGGAPATDLVNLALDDEAKIGGTNMAVIVAPAAGGGTAIGIVFLDAQGLPIVGTYSGGISNRYVQVVKVTGPATTQMTYRHGVY
jgi:hypothetical protein